MIIDIEAIDSSSCRICLAGGVFWGCLATAALLDGDGSRAAAALAMVGAFFAFYRLQRSLLVALDRWLDRKIAEARER